MQKNLIPDIFIKDYSAHKETPVKHISPKITKPVSAAKGLQRSLTNIKITETVTRPFPDKSDLDKALISSTNADGPVLTIPFTTSTNASTETGIKQPEGKPLEPIERAPEFPGGMNAWVKFLSANLITPSDLDAGEKKTVMIRFKVSTDGTVNGFEILQSAGSIYDNEVIRVLKKMPKWKPAMQNGHTVSTSFTQPVTFMGVEQ